MTEYVLKKDYESYKEKVNSKIEESEIRYATLEANFYYMEVKKFRIYRINNLTNPPSLMMATPIGEQKSIDESIKEDEKSIEEEKADDIKEILDDENNFETKK